MTRGRERQGGRERKSLLMLDEGMSQYVKVGLSFGVVGELSSETESAGRRANALQLLS